MRDRWPSLVRRIGLFGVLWIVLTGADPRAWGLAILIVVGSALISLGFGPWRRTPRFRGSLRFAGSFLQLSFRGGLDVALRAFRPTSPLDPGLITFPFRLPAGGARTVFMTAVGLLPGTVGVGVEEDSLRIHVLDRRSPVEPYLRLLEARIADTFDIGLVPLDVSDPER